MRITSGGAQLGEDITVRVGIMRSDSPYGVFSFSTPEIRVMESKYLTDPKGVALIDVYRQGTEGLVSVQWRVAASAVQDFDEPLFGTLVFNPVSI